MSNNVGDISKGGHHYCTDELIYLETVRVDKSTCNTRHVYSL